MEATRAAKNSLWFVTPAVVATGVALALALASEPPEDIATGPTASRVPDTTLADTGDLVSLLELLAPSAAGATSGELAIAEANNPDALLAGSEAAPAAEGPMRGRVEQHAEFRRVDTEKPHASCVTNKDGVSVVDAEDGIVLGGEGGNRKGGGREEQRGANHGLRGSNREATPGTGVRSGLRGGGTRLRR